MATASSTRYGRRALLLIALIASSAHGASDAPSKASDHQLDNRAPSSWKPIWDWETRAATPTPVLEHPVEVEYESSDEGDNRPLLPQEQEAQPTATAASTAPPQQAQPSLYPVELIPFIHDTQEDIGSDAGYETAAELDTFHTGVSDLMMRPDYSNDPIGHPNLRSRTDDEVPLLPYDKLGDLDRGLDKGPTGMAEIRCLNEENLQRLIPPFNFRLPTYWPPGYDPQQYTNFRQVCARATGDDALPNVGCFCDRSAATLHNPTVPMLCPPTFENTRIYSSFINKCVIHCSCRSVRPSKTSELYKDLGDPDGDDEEDKDKDPKKTRTGFLPKATAIMRNGISIFIRGKTYEVRYPNWLKRRLHRSSDLEPIQRVPLESWDPVNKKIVLEDPNLPVCDATTGKCESQYTLSIGDANPQARCGGSCTSNAQCASGNSEGVNRASGQGCSCVVDPSFHQAKQAGVDFLFPPAICLSLALLTGATKYSGANGRLGGRSVGAEPVGGALDLGVSCHCNATYASGACCGSGDGVVWEGPRANVLSGYELK